MGIAFFFFFFRTSRTVNLLSQEHELVSFQLEIKN